MLRRSFRNDILSRSSVFAARESTSEYGHRTLLRRKTGQQSIGFTCQTKVNWFGCLLTCLVKNLEHVENVCKDNVEETAIPELLSEPMKPTVDKAPTIPEVKISTPNGQLPNKEVSFHRGHGNQRRKANTQENEGKELKLQSDNQRSERTRQHVRS